MDLTVSCVNIWNDSETEEAHVCWTDDTISECQFFLQKERYFPTALQALRTWTREESSLQTPLVTGPIVLALIETAPHGILLMWTCSLSRTRWISEDDGSAHATTTSNHSTRNLYSSDLAYIQKTDQRTDEIQSVIIDDLILVSIITRLLCLLCPIDHLLQRSSHPFRAIFANLLHALELNWIHFTPYKFWRGGVTVSRMLCRDMDSIIEKGRWPSLKIARINLKESIADYNSICTSSKACLL